MHDINEDLQRKAQNAKRASEKQSNNIISKKDLEFNYKLLPHSVGLYAKDVAYGMDNAPLSFACVSALIVLSSSIGARVGVRPKLENDWTVIPNLWGALIAPPSIKKTPIYEEMLKPLVRAEIKENDKYQDKMREYNREDMIYQEEIKTYKKRISKGDTEGLSEPLKSEQPAQTRYIINDATTEKVGEIMNDNPNGILVTLDELSGFFATLTRSGRESDRSFWLTGFNGNRGHSIDRINRGSFYIKRVCASIFGTIQPDSINKLIDSAINGNENDGLIQRFQLIAIETKSHYQYVDKAPNKEERKKYNSLVDKLLYANPLEYGAKQEYENGDKFYRFDKEANAIYKDWSEELHKRMKEYEIDNPILSSHLGKFNSLFASLALILFYSDRVMGMTQEDSISEIYATRAKELCDYFEYQAQKLYDLQNMQEAKNNNKREKLLNKLRELDANKELPITYGKLSQYFRGLKAKDCQELLNGYIKEKDKRIFMILK